MCCATCSRSIPIPNSPWHWVVLVCVRQYTVGLRNGHICRFVCWQVEEWRGNFEVFASLRAAAEHFQALAYRGGGSTRPDTHPRLPPLCQAGLTTQVGGDPSYRAPSHRGVLHQGPQLAGRRVPGPGILFYCSLLFFSCICRRCIQKCSSTSSNTSCTRIRAPEGCQISPRTKSEPTKNRTSWPSFRLVLNKSGWFV